MSEKISLDSSDAYPNVCCEYIHNIHRLYLYLIGIYISLVCKTINRWSEPCDEAGFR